jgi:hypothetical protein
VQGAGRRVQGAGCIHLIGCPLEDVGEGSREKRGRGDPWQGGVG